jgi:hypothetical protein
MPTYVRVRGLARRGIRLRSSIGAQNAVTVSNRQITTVDLDDANTRADLGHHVSIGQLLVLDTVPRSTFGAYPNTVVQTGAVATSAGSGTFQVNVSAGTLLTATAATTSTTQAVAAQTVTIGNPSAQPRVDTIQVATATGVATVVAGTAAVAGASAPAAAGGNIAIAEVYVAPGATQPSYVKDVRPLP